ncbi:MAG: hypothetical protein Kow0077_14120 [Anaerolineae bacterium]
MSVRVFWDDPEHTIICMAFTGEWTWEEVEAARQREHAMLRQVSHTVDILLDFTNASNAPDNPILSMRRMSSYRPENVGAIVLVGASTHVQTLTRIYRRLFAGDSVQFDTALTHDQARQLLRDYRKKARA